MAGISSKAAGKLENRRKFNDGTEFNTDLGLDWYETAFRGYDPQIGRFNQMDPLADHTESWSQYAFVQNNPLLFNDPLGLDTLRVNLDGTLPSVRPDGSSLQDSDIILDSDGFPTIYFNGETWQESQKLDDVNVVGKKKTTEPIRPPSQVEKLHNDIAKMGPVTRWLYNLLCYDDALNWATYADMYCNNPADAYYFGFTCVVMNADAARVDALTGGRIISGQTINLSRNRRSKPVIQPTNNAQKTSPQNDKTAQAQKMVDRLKKSGTANQKNRGNP